MKLFVIALGLAVISKPTFADECKLKLPLSEIEKAIALVPNAGLKTCADLPNEECLCYEGVVWEMVKLVDDFGNRKKIMIDSEKFQAVNLNRKTEAEWREANNTERMQALAMVDSISADVDLDSPTNIATLKVKLKEMKEVQKVLLRALKALRDYNK